VVKGSKNKDTAARLIEFLQGDAARNAFRAAGFILK
jgi:ABC-type molybdate transport system substrate-binding protein